MTDFREHPDVKKLFAFLNAEGLREQGYKLECVKINGEIVAGKEFVCAENEVILSGDFFLAMINTEKTLTRTETERKQKTDAQIKESKKKKSSNQSRSIL